MSARISTPASLPLAARWGAMAVGLLLAAAGPARPGIVMGGGVLLAHALWRTVVGGRRRLADVTVDSVITIAVVGLTGGAASPFLPVAVATALAIGVAATGRAEGAALAEANDLLSELHQLTLGLETPLDAPAVAAASAHRVCQLDGVDQVVLSLRQPSDETWMVVAVAGRVPVSLVGEVDADAVGRLLPGGQCFALRVRGQLIGLLEAAGERVTGRTSAITAIVGDTALAIDNARLFARLRTLAAEEERTRIARELHDELGASLAGLAFDLDRLRGEVPAGLVDDIERLGESVRASVASLRETLTDLRTDVGNGHLDGLRGELASLVERITARTGLRTTVDVEDEVALPVHARREVLRIAQEAVRNAERHAAATSVSVCISGGVLEISDDGLGMMRPDDARRRFGLIGMRERAESIGASLEVRSMPGRGTTVRCTLPVISATSGRS